MKKNLWFAALVGVALTSCVSDESSPMEEQKQLVTFTSPVFRTQTRAVAGEIIGAYPTNETFNVFCRRYVGDTFTSWLAPNSTDYFNVQTNPNVTEAVEMKHVSSVWVSKSNINYYWPGLGYSLAFAAYSPADADGTISYGASGLNIVDFTTEAESDEQYDLLYSDRVVECTNENYGKVNKSVPLVFRHALSSIIFAASANQPSREYTITGIKVVGKFATRGDFDEGIVENTHITQSNPNWDNLTDNNDSNPILITTTYTPVINEVIVNSAMNEFTAGESALLLIPQIVPNDAKILLSYKVENTDVGTETAYTDLEIPLNYFKKTDNNPIGEWEINHRYIYQITFGGSNPISFSPSVAGWEPDIVASYEVK